MPDCSTDLYSSDQYKQAGYKKVSNNVDRLYIKYTCNLVFKNQLLYYLRKYYGEKTYY